MPKCEKMKIAAAWNVEIDRRVQNLINGKTKRTSAQIAMARGRKALKK
jgi:hypothetical protein